ncbi:hypothetical protein [Halomarina pelagica]|uniref:hypothetical protein n=1 Tax=Halomarina pelagica TaxID=2961599 RepID=UPI0020C2D128|nr:hypothetical protein [Halomarina sp. BND7]
METQSPLSEAVENLRGAARELVDGVSFRELLGLFVVIPGILLAVEGAIQSDYWLLAGVTRSDFYSTLIGQQLFSVDTIVEAYLSSVAHQNWASHLKGNLIAYILCVSALYPMAVLSREKRRVGQVFALVLVTAPLFVSVMSILYPMGRQSIGFSGVLSAFYGMLPVVTVAAIDVRVDTDFDAFWSLIVMFTVYTLLLVIVGSFVYAAGVFAIVAGLLVWFLVRVKLDGAMEVLRVATSPEYPMFIWAVTIAITGVGAMFYQLAPGTNVVAHLAGYMFGFLGAFLLLGDGGISDALPFESV